MTAIVQLCNPTSPNISNSPANRTASDLQISNLINTASSSSQQSVSVATSAEIHNDNFIAKQPIESLSNGPLWKDNQYIHSQLTTASLQSLPLSAHWKPATRSLRSDVSPDLVPLQLPELRSTTLSKHLQHLAQHSYGASGYNPQPEWNTSYVHDLDNNHFNKQRSYSDTALECKNRRDARQQYDREELDFLIYLNCYRRTTARIITWRFMVEVFHERFPPGTRRRRFVRGMSPVYVERSDGGLQSRWYRAERKVKQAWGQDEALPLDAATAVMCIAQLQHKWGFPTIE
jgi:hypothetical protein